MVAKASDSGPVRAATTAASVSVVRRGVSPERISTGPPYPRSEDLAASTAWAVPSCLSCRAKRSGAPGSAARSEASTSSPWCPTTTTTGLAPASRARLTGK